MNGQPFIKMHGLGNDFVVLDARGAPLPLSAATARAIADRRTGVGCDQIIAIEPSPHADAFMRIRNADGGEVAACGNATRCVAAMLFTETGRDRVTIATSAGLLTATPAAGERVTVDMGAPALGWRDIPLAREMDTLHLDLVIGPARAPVLADPAAVGMGNPHAVFFVADADEIDLATVGPMLETHPLFPERANIGIAQVLSEDAVRLRVWERGVGLTLACGTGACAAAVAGHRRGYTGRRVTMRLDGGDLEMEWRAADGHVLMTGPVATSFSGTLDPALLEAGREAAA